MKLSLFTPTHRPTHLAELYTSLLRQKGEIAWEWLIVPNGNCKPDDITVIIKEDPRVRILPSELKGIGALKRFACDSCTGDVYVEVDHDDILASNCFEELAKAYSEEPTGFYYSDFINVRPNGTCETYGCQYGWVNYRCTVDGFDYVACRAFPPTARSMCHIFYAPNHIRAWSSTAYKLSGGHDPALAVGDDHDLVCRTYIAGVPFGWIQKPLYIYRRSDKQSFLEFNKEIQIQQQANCNKYLHELVTSECLRENTPRLDIGRAQWAQEGYESVDIVAKRFAPLPFPDQSVGCVRAIDTLQRVPRDQIVPLMNEIHRVLRPAGWLLSSTPAIDDGNGKVGRGVFQDPTHCSYWSNNNFWYFTQKRYAGMLDGYTGRFQCVRLWTHYPTEWHEQNAIPYVSADLSALHGQRQAGDVHI